MKNTVMLPVLILCAIFSLLSCIHTGENRNNSEKVYVFRPENESFSMNVSLSYIMWGTGSCGDKQTAIPVHNDDLLNIYLSDAGTIALLYRYNEKDGIHGQFSCKKSNETAYLYTMNNSVIQLNLSNTSDVWQWLENAPESDLKTIRSLCFAGEIDASHYHLLQKVAKIKNNPDMYFENSRQLMNVLPMFQPDCITIGRLDNPDDGGSGVDINDILRKQKNLKQVFFIPGGKYPVQNYKFLSSLSFLKSIMIPPSLFNQMSTTALPGNLKNLEELIISGEDNDGITGLSIIKDLKKIRKLRFIKTHISGDMKDLHSLPRLSTLSFSGTEVENILEIPKIPVLQWFSFPVNTDQADFKAFLEKNSQLEYLEMVNCENISDLSPVKYLKNLKGIILIDMEIEDYSPLSTLKSLEFLILPKNFFEKDGDDRLGIEELKKNLPDSAIVCGEPFCLGSGWILLFPLSVILCLVLIACRKKIKIYINKKM